RGAQRRGLAATAPPLHAGRQRVYERILRSARTSSVLERRRDARVQLIDYPLTADGTLHPLVRFFEVDVPRRRVGRRYEEREILAGHDMRKPAREHDANLTLCRLDRR